MNELTDFQARAAGIALHKLLHGTTFYINDLDNLAKLIGQEVGGRDYEALRGLHCMKWADMPEPLRTQARDKVIELLGITPPPIEAEPATPQPAPQIEASPGLRLAFWR